MQRTTAPLQSLRASAFPTDFIKTYEYLELVKIRTLPGYSLDPGQYVFILKCCKRWFRAHKAKCQLCEHLSIKGHIPRTF